FKLPENYYAIIETASGEKIYADDGGIRCDCGSGAGGTCVPVKVGDKLGCFQSNGCTTCTATYFRTKGDAQPITIKNINIMLGNIETAKEDDITREDDLQGTTAFLKESKLVEQLIIPINSYSEMKKMKYISEQDLKSDFVDEQIKFIIEGAAKKSKSTEKVLSPISIKGKLAFLVLPRDFVENSSGIFRLYDDEAGLKCSGNCQAGSCVKKSRLFGEVVWCEGCNSGCSLSD
ncbi:MAG: hypothetical protein SFU27_01415, partial [Thermonemataceae bacterium]|nr:hypothetical protein [Thermonemataceae bacterium]